MFCPKCSIELKDPNQKFCMNCGNEIPTTLEAYQARDFPVGQQIPVKIEELQDQSSKKCLGFAIVSIALAIFCFLLVGPIIFFGLLYRWIWAMLLLIHIFGLIFGILAKINCRKVEYLEPVNSIKKAGNVFSIFGIILNAISLALLFLS